jgi:flagellar hook-associated protein 3 FlgL
MIQGFGASHEWFLAALQVLQRHAERANAQVSSGYKITSPADDPGALDSLFRIGSDLSRAEQTQKNLSRVKAEIDGSQNAIDQAVRIVENAIALGTQGATATDPATKRPILAEQVRHLHEQLVGLSQTQVEGRFTFSGDADSTEAYKVNLANPNGVDRLLTSPTTRLIQDVGGTSFAVAKTAQDIFDQRNPNDTLASDNVFAAVNSLRTALVGNSPAGIDTALTALHGALDHLNQHLAFYGTVQNQVQSAIDLASKFQVQWQQRQSEIRDADLVGSALELSKAQTQIEAALSAKARFPGTTSLFDFLK